MIYYDWSLRVRTGWNLSVRVDRSTEVAGWHTLPDASNYMSVSVRGPFELCPLWKQRAAPEHARPAAVWMSPGCSARTKRSFLHSTNSFSLHQNHCDAVNLLKLKCNLCQIEMVSEFLIRGTSESPSKLVLNSLSFSNPYFSVIYVWRRWGSIWVNPCLIGWWWPIKQLES